MSRTNHEIYIKFSVTDLYNFFNWLEDGVEGHKTTGFDGFYTLVSDGKAHRSFDAHLHHESLEALAIEKALFEVMSEKMRSDDSDEILPHNSKISKINDLFSE